MLQPGDFKIYNASAGTGKTYTLVKEFISILLKDDNVYRFEHILAITFTNKAANEMKARIIEKLEELIDPKNIYSDYNLSIATDINKKPEDIPNKAREILIAILHNYSKFSISTIDKFNLRLMKSFAQDLGLSINFDVEMNTEEIIEESIDLLYSKIGDDPKLTNTILSISMDNMDDDKSWDIRKNLADITNQITNDKNLNQLDKLKKIPLEQFITYRKEIDSNTKTIKQGIKEIGSIFNDILKNNNLSIDQFPGKKARGLGAFLFKLENWDGKTLPSSDGALKETIDDKFLSTKNLDPTLESIYPEIKNLLNQFLQLKDSFILLNAIKKQIASISLINEVEKSIEILKKESNVLLINEFNTQISKHLKNQPANFIYERIGSKYQHYFIDEFQDTSTLQWENFTPLIDNARAQSDTVMLVGDAKQSIYRWRGGNPEQMIDLINNKESLDIKVEDLSTNWRSHQNIITFNNELYTFLAPKLNSSNFKQLYTDGNKQAYNHRKEGFIHVNFIDTNNLDNKEYKEENLQFILKYVNQCLDNGFALNDIAILVLSNADGANIAKYLTDNNLTVLSNQALLLKNTNEIKLLEYLFKITSNPLDDQSKIRFFITAYDLKLFETEDLTNTINKSLKNKQIGFIKLCKEIGFDLDYILDENLSLYDFTEKSIRNLKLQHKSPAYIISFLNIILDYTSKNEANINTFLEFWETAKKTASVKTPEGVNAIQIMTIHKSKGLEFPVVILPFLNWRQKNNSIWIPLQKNESNPFDNFYIDINNDLKTIQNKEVLETIAEEENLSQLDIINTFYVATTRAKEQLYLIAEKPKEKSTSTTNAINQYLFDFTQQKGFKEDEFTMFGSPKRINVSDKKIINSTEIDVFSTDWNNKLVVNTSSEKTQQKLLTTEYANAIHLVLSKIITAKDSKKIIDLEYRNGTISINNLEKITTSIQQIVTNETLAPYFDENLIVLNERDFIDENGEIFRADRVVIDQKNNCTIIDYKTGQPEITHHLQINKYADFFKKIGYTIQKKLLIYINEEKGSITNVVVD